MDVVEPKDVWRRQKDDTWRAHRRVLEDGQLVMFGVSLLDSGIEAGQATGLLEKSMRSSLERFPEKVRQFYGPDVDVTKVEWDVVANSIMWEALVRTMSVRFMAETLKRRGDDVTRKRVSGIQAGQRVKTEISQVDTGFEVRGFTGGDAMEPSCLACGAPLGPGGAQSTRKLLASSVDPDEVVTVTFEVCDLCSAVYPEHACA